MKVFVISHWYDYEGGSVLAVYSSKEKAIARLQHEYDQAVLEHKEYAELITAEGWSGFSEIDPPEINLDNGFVCYYGNNYGLREYELDEE